MECGVRDLAHPTKSVQLSLSRHNVRDRDLTGRWPVNQGRLQKSKLMTDRSWNVRVLIVAISMMHYWFVMTTLLYIYNFSGDHSPIMGVLA